MVNLFGDWWGDATVMFLIFLAFVFMWLFYFKKKEKRNEAGLLVAVIIFIISGAEILGLFWGDTSFGPPEGFFLSIIVVILSLIFSIVALVQVLSDRD